MEPSVVLVTLILQIASSRCRNIEFLNDELNIDRDFLPSNIPGHIAFPSPPNDDFYQNLDRFNELKKFLKVIPYKGKGDLKNKTIPGEHEDDKDFPIAVIMASNLDENLSDNLNPADINDYFTKVIENSYKLDKTIDDRRKKGKTHAEHALENDNERLLQHEAKLQFTTNRPTHGEQTLENDNERLLQHEAKLQFTTNRPTHAEHALENDNERLLQHEAKLQFTTNRPTHAEHALENDSERLLHHEAKLQFTTNRPTHAEHALENDNERLLQHEAKLQFTTNRPTHAEHALENDNERLLQHEAKLQFTTNRPTHAEHALENDNERLLQHEAKLQFTTNRPTHAEHALENDNERLLQHEAKLQFSTSRSTIDLNDKVLDQESTELLNEMDLKKTLNEVKKKPNTSSNTQTPTFTNNASSQHSPIHIEDISSIQHLLPTTEKSINLNKIDAHDDITLQEDDILNMHDLIKSIHDLDKLQFEKYVEENNDTFNKTLGVKSPKHQKIISCKEFNITDHLTDRNYNLKFVFNF
ncbi:uncharacterized protein LOC124542240 isoform X2 [Vanessa cardui]|uniref:uncharacterized protein LOC124542240 isoform X2 n=1 Tax=Vanessa cardui TaxID=171605 RepID=UPI001F145254|nr:uncharacterized protein LOC124542240 isoform X2 [Vanessa cardui]